MKAKTTTHASRRPRPALLLVIALIIALLPACAGGHQFDITPTPIPPTPTNTPTATPIPPTPTLTPTPTRTPLIIPTPYRQATPTPSNNSSAWRKSGSLLEPRAWHTATVLADGTVLVVGGYGEVDDPTSFGYGLIATAERFNPQDGSWRAAGTMTDARDSHTATLLADGTVLAVGGENDDHYLATAEIYDPKTGQWRATGSLTTPRSRHTATALPDGSVLVLGGDTSPDGLLPEDEEDVISTPTAERYDPATGAWQPAGNLLVPRSGHTTTPLPNGELLVAGGLPFFFDESDNLPTAERFNPQTGISRAAADLAALHYEQTAFSLPEGRVIVIGDASREAEIYDPLNDRWSPAGRIALERYSFTATLLPTGLVLVLGAELDDDSAELFTPLIGTITPVAQPAERRIGHTATLLADGSVLVTGGFDLDDSDRFVKTAERFTPAQPQATAPRQPGEYRANFTVWPQRTLASATLRQVADPTGTTYRVHLSRSYGWIGMPVPERTRFTNFTAEVTLDLGDSSEVSGGLVFRSQGGLDFMYETYVLYISPDGSFGLVRIDEDGDWHFVQPAIATAALHPNGVQRLRVTCDGETIAVAINDQPVGRYHAAITSPGQVGLFAVAWGSEPLDAVFSQLRIIPLP